MKKKVAINKSEVIVDKLNENLIEVKITVYTGKEKIDNSGYSAKKNKESIRYVSRPILL
jgi:hypothetical protein|tara:strand:- start:210 stop:386 length:177 start_codon:yes stop_codon:yes gene_type:complete